MITSFAPIFSGKKLQSQTVSREKLHKTLLYKKVPHKMLVNLTQGVNFINVLDTAFWEQIPKAQERLTA